MLKGICQVPCIELEYCIAQVGKIKQAGTISHNSVYIVHSKGRGFMGMLQESHMHHPLSSAEQASREEVQGFVFIIPI